MHNVSRIAAILLVVLATVLALAAFSLGKRRQEAPPAAPPVAAAPAAPVAPAKTAHVVVAAQMLLGGEVISATSLREVAVSSAPEGSYEQPELLVGEVPRVNIPEGTVITASLLSNPIAMQLRPGERALAVPVDEISGVGYRVQPGDYVDVVLTLKIADPSANGMTIGKEHSESRLLASRLRVLAYGVRDLPRLGVAAPASTKTETTEPPPKMAVLAVPLDDIDPLVLGAQSGKLSLALRHPGDDGMPSNLLFPLPSTVLAPRGDLTGEQRGWLASPENRAYAGVDEPGLVGRSKMAAPRPASRAASPAGLEIIRGSSSAASSHTSLAVNP
ncbi:pilus assembly protein CpaB [Dyella jiangningensis]|uniref:Flp pilus assembly protein CpaB n=1 Tax=Dyella sp. AtDHG13 TaxID=1938897 RepID=UPI00088B4936|nr:Flp pilus assembly protein CpaB [Dyella sp. AtDHG13]PXV55334.1 pilus assembly protein CpaB [Dyella sp. AtDHG13]SDK80381.1 pilus assembly protein CpaB [Dyella jiangningensis]